MFGIFFERMDCVDEWVFYFDKLMVATQQVLSLYGFKIHF